MRCLATTARRNRISVVSVAEGKSDTGSTTVLLSADDDDHSLCEFLRARKSGLVTTLFGVSVALRGPGSAGAGGAAMDIGLQSNSRKSREIETLFCFGFSCWSACECSAWSLPV